MHGKVHNKVSAFRTERKITQEELAKVIGVSRQTIVAIEKGNYAPSVQLAIKIAKHFETKVEQLFNIVYE